MFAVLLLAFRANWKQFASERDVMTACRVCRDVAKMVNTNSAAAPSAGSPCENEESGYCKFVEDLKADMHEAYNGTVPETACSEIGPCLGDAPANLWGPRCNKCLTVSGLILAEEREKRESYMKSFCYAVGREFTGFCHELTLLGDAAVVPLYENATDAQEFCLASKFCLVKDGSAIAPEVEALHTSKRSKRALKRMEERKAKKAKKELKKAKKAAKAEQEARDLEL